MNYDCYAKKKKKKKKTLSIWIHPVRPNYYLHFATQSYMASTSQQSDAWVLENLKSKASILITCPLPPSVFCSRLFRKDVKYCPSQSPKPSTACNPVTDTCSRQVEITRLKFLRHLNSCFTGKWITKPLCNHENQSFKTELLTATKANTYTDNLKPQPHLGITLRPADGIEVYGKRSISSTPIPSAHCTPWLRHACSPFFFTLGYWVHKCSFQIYVLLIQCRIWVSC